MRFRVTAAALGAAILLGASAPAYAATDPAGAPSEVRFSTARGDAPKLHPGVYGTTAPTGDTERYAAITRPRGGAVTVAIFGSVDAKITTSDGNTTCSSSSVSLSNSETGYTFVYVDGAQDERQSYQSDDCKSATDLILQIKADDSSSSSSSSSTTSGGPLQLAVTVEPRIEHLGSPSPKSEQDEIKAPSKSNGASRALSDQLFAPTSLTPGSYRVDLVPGQLAVARVRVGWGQRLAASVDAPRNGSNFAPAESLELNITAFSPQWAPVGGGSGSQLLSKDSATEETAGTYTAPVNAANRTLGYGDTGDVGTNSAQWTTVAGWYYLVVQLGASDAGAKVSTTKLPARLNLAVTGSPTPGPSYVGTDGKAVAAPPATELSRGGHNDSGSGSATVLRVAGSALVIALAAGVVALLLRRRA
ncbi:MAG TPA: hypothetical protein VG502_13845 [Flexivirga sp.]|uniref:hypothetical protein n=1 Tax=Flexivirga sp. TaxID=1962927 RepID=UPI002B5E776A|nr:hypothetical protein [Flexivirga sp.]HWC23377.1 hypothetical protein [Flexivirga sp.]